MEGFSPQTLRRVNAVTLVQGPHDYIKEQPFCVCMTQGSSVDLFLILEQMTLLRLKKQSVARNVKSTEWTALRLLAGWF